MLVVLGHISSFILSSPSFPFNPSILVPPYLFLTLYSEDPLLPLVLYELTSLVIQIETFNWPQLVSEKKKLKY